MTRRKNSENSSNGLPREHMNLKMLRFGTEYDYQNMVLEIKWLKSIKGELDSRDIEYLSNKYLFPPVFVEATIKGHISISDLMINRSKWYPIITFWIIDQYYRYSAANNSMYRYIQKTNRIYQFLFLIMITIIPLISSLILILHINPHALYQLAARNPSILLSSLGALGLIFNGIRYLRDYLKESRINVQKAIRKTLLPDRTELYHLYNKIIDTVLKLNSFHLRIAVAGIISMMIIIPCTDYFLNLKLIGFISAIILWMLLGVFISLIVNRNIDMISLRKELISLIDRPRTKVLNKELQRAFEFTFPQYYLEGLFKSLAQNTIYANIFELAKNGDKPVYYVEPLGYIIRVYKERIKKLEETSNKNR